MGRQTNLKPGRKKKQLVTLMEEAAVASGGRGKEERRRGSFEKHAAGGRGYIFVVCIHI